MTRTPRLAATVLGLLTALGVLTALLAPLAPGASADKPNVVARGYSATISRIGPALADRMTPTSYRRGCPVPLNELRYLQMTFWGFDGNRHTGEMVVRAPQAVRITRVFGKLYDARFPVRRMRLVDDYRGSDAQSMKANNTSAFNCRKVAGTSRWSEHSYGRAVDLNPIQNPYVKGGFVDPKEGARYAYVDRSPGARYIKGVIRSRDVVVRAFADASWSWGGYWRSAKDYQHFSRTGR